MRAGAVIDLRPGGWSRLAANLREEKGLGLIELLISLLVLNLGIFATMGAFTSGAVAIRNASRISTASALADKNTEAFRDMSFSSIPTGTTTANQTGADGLTYSVTTAVTSGTAQTSGITPAPTYSGSTAIKVVTITITNSGRTVYGPASTTFSQCAQDLTATSCAT